jgi:hypothetical protein
MLNNCGNIFGKYDNIDNNENIEILVYSPVPPFRRDPEQTVPYDD